MSDDVAEKPAKRKILGLRVKREPEQAAPDTRYILPGTSVFMVWNAEGAMPKRVYTPDEQHLACRHAYKLAQETGKRFFVMRAWRGFDPA